MWRWRWIEYNPFERRPCTLCGKRMFRFVFFTHHIVWCWPWDTTGKRLPRTTGKVWTVGGLNTAIAHRHDVTVNSDGRG